MRPVRRRRSRSHSITAYRSASTARAPRPFNVIQSIGKIAGAYGFGRVDMVEDRLVGIKSREIYEGPAALALITAHTDLENLVLERSLGREKKRLEATWAQLVYEGLWFSPLKRAIDAFAADSAEAVTGDVRLRFSPDPARRSDDARRTRCTTSRSRPTTTTTVRSLRRRRLREAVGSARHATGRWHRTVSNDATIEAGRSSKDEGGCCGAAASPAVRTPTCSG